MSKDKSALKIIDKNHKLIIRAGSDFAEKASNTKEILSQLEKAEDKKVRIFLSAKTKNYESTYFLIRQKVIDLCLEDVQILPSNESGPVFRQQLDEDGNYFLSTNTHNISIKNDGNETLYIRFNKKEKTISNSKEAKEIISTIQMAEPEKITFFFSRAEKESHENYLKRIKHLENYFITRIIPLYDIKEILFFVNTDNEPILSSHYCRQDGSKLLTCLEQKNLCVKVSHQNAVNTICEDTQNTKS